MKKAIHGCRPSSAYAVAQTNMQKSITVAPYHTQSSTLPHLTHDL
jgi:hypothetical protein